MSPKTNRTSRASGGVANADETHFASPLEGNVDLPATQPKQKICAVCGKDVAHEERFKDHTGRYWCYECGTEDNRRKQSHEPVSCPDCHNAFPQEELALFENVSLCKDCVHKRELAHKRERARIAAAEEAAREAARNQKMMIFGASAAAGLAVLYALWAVLT